MDASSITGRQAEGTCSHTCAEWGEDYTSLGGVGRGVENGLHIKARLRCWVEPDELPPPHSQI